jgi:hypothetical protein
MDLCGKVFGILCFMSPDYVTANFPNYNEFVQTIYELATRLLFKHYGLSWLQYAKTKSST